MSHLGAGETLPAPPPEFLIQYVWSEAENLHFQQMLRDAKADTAGPGTTL